MSTKNTIQHTISPILVTAADAAKVLGMSRQEFYRRKKQMIANHGLTQIQTGNTFKYSYSELSEIVERCRVSGKPLYTIE